VVATRPIYHNGDIAILGRMFCPLLALLPAEELEEQRHGVAAE
jgi:hypothetical protein